MNTEQVATSTIENFLARTETLMAHINKNDKIPVWDGEVFVYKSKPQISIPKIKLPTRIIELAYKPGSKTTIVLTMDNGWAISFRIHSASTIVEPSLKFDIQLLGQPADMFYIDVEW